MPVKQPLRGETTVEEIAARLEAAFNAKDAAKLASLYTKNATLMPQNEGMVKGRVAIQAWLQTALGRVGTVQITPMQSSTMGAEAFQVGTFTVAPADSPSQRRGYKYVLILKHIGTEWLIDCDIWNSDEPPPASAT